MIQTLRITGFLVVLLAGALLAFPIVYGVNNTPEDEKILNTPSVVAQLREKANGSTSSSPSESPLVTNARQFALHINPPAPPRTYNPGSTGRTLPREMVRPTVPISTKFTLIGTIFNKDNPEDSIMLINEPGKGLYWVRKKDQIGRLVVEDIQDGYAVIRDGDRTSEIAVQQRSYSRPIVVNGETDNRSAIDGRPSSFNSSLPDEPDFRPITSRDIPSGRNAQDSYRSRPVSEVVPGYVITTSPPPLRPQYQSEINEEERQALNKLVEQLRAIQRSANSNKTDSNAEVDQEKMMQDLITQFRDSRISDNEADRLEELGEALNSAMPNQ